MATAVRSSNSSNSNGAPPRPSSRGRAPFGDASNRSNGNISNNNNSKTTSNSDNIINSCDNSSLESSGAMVGKKKTYARDTASSKRRMQYAASEYGDENNSGLAHSSNGSIGEGNGGGGGLKRAPARSDPNISNNGNNGNNGNNRSSSTSRVRTGSSSSNFQSLRDAFQKRSQSATRAGLAHTQSTPGPSRGGSGGGGSGGPVSLSDGFPQQKQKSSRPPSRSRGQRPSSSSSSSSNATAAKRQPIEIYDESAAERRDDGAQQREGGEPQEEEEEASVPISSPRVTVSKSQLDRLVSEKGQAADKHRSYKASAYEAHVRLKSAEHTIGSLKKEMDEMRHFKEVEHAESRDDRAIQTETEEDHGTTSIANGDAAAVNTNSTKKVESRGTTMSTERVESESLSDDKAELLDQARLEANHLRRENNNLQSEIGNLRATVERANVTSDNLSKTTKEESREVKRLSKELASTRDELQEMRGTVQSNELFSKLRRNLELKAEELQGQLGEERRVRGELERELAAERAAASSASRSNRNVDDDTDDESDEDELREKDEDLSAAMAELVEKDEMIKSLTAKLRKKDEEMNSTKRVVPFDSKRGPSSASADYDELVKKEQEIASLRETMQEWSRHHRDCDVKSELLAEQEEKLRDANDQIRAANDRADQLGRTLDEAKNTMMLVQNENTRHLEKSIKAKDVNSMQQWSKWKKTEAGLRANHEQRNRELQESLRTAEALEFKLAESERNVAIGADQIKALEGEIEAMSNDLEATEQDAVDLAAKVDIANAAVTTTRAMVVDLETKLAEQAERAIEYKAKFKNASKSLDIIAREAEEHSATTAKVLAEKELAIEVMQKELEESKEQKQQIKELQAEVEEGQEEIKALQKELEQTSTAATNTRTRLNERETLLCFMEKEVNEAKAAKEELVKLKAQHIKLVNKERSLSMQLEDAAEHLANKESTLSNLTNEHVEAKGEKQVLYESLQQSSDRVKELQEGVREKAAAFETEKKAMQELVAEKESVIEGLKEEVSVSKMQKQAMETNLQQGTDQVKEVQAQVKQQAAEMEDMRCTFDLDRSVLEKSVQKLKGMVASAEDDALASKVRIRELECEIEELREACVNAKESQSAFENAGHRVRTLEGTTKELEGELQSSRKTLETREATIARLQEQVEEQEEQMQEHCDRIKSSAKEMQSVLEESNNRQHSLDTALTELDAELQDSLKLNEEHEGTISKMEGLFQEYEKKVNAANDSVEVQKESFNSQVNLLRKVNGDMESINESLRSELETKVGEFVTSTQKVLDLEITVAHLNDQLREQQGELERSQSTSASAASIAKAEIETLERLADELRMDLVSCQDELSTARREKEELDVVVTEMKAHLERANSDAAGTASKVATLQNGLDEARMTLAEVTSQRETKEVELVATAQQAKIRAEIHESDNVSLKNQIEEKILIIQKLEIERDVYKNGIDRASGEKGSLQADYKALEATVGMYRETLESLEDVTKERIKSLEEQLLDAERTHADAERELNDALSAKASIEKEAESAKEATAREIDALKATIARVQVEADQAKQQAASKEVIASAAPQKIGTSAEDLNSSIDGHGTPKKQIGNDLDRQMAKKDEEMDNMRVCLEFMKERVGTANKKNAKLEKSVSSLRLKCISMENSMRSMQRSAPEGAETMRSPDCVSSSEVGNDRQTIETAALAKYMHNRQKKLSEPSV